MDIHFLEETVTCTFLTGSATVNDTSVSINVKGTASYPPDSTGCVESSPFNLIMTGGFNNGKASGTWEISFTKEDWMDWAPDGAFTGSLQQGNGITNRLYVEYERRNNKRIKKDASHCELSAVKVISGS
jgi:hypothetical protein